MNVGCRGLYQFRIPVSGAGRLSPLRYIVWGNCVRAEVACVSENLAGHWVFRFSFVVDRLFVPAATVDFAFSFVELPLTAPFLPISLDASPFHQYCRVQEYRKTAFVRLKLQENGYPIPSKSLTIPVIPHRLYSFPYSLSYYNTSFTYRYPPKETPQSRSAQILRKAIAKPTVAAGTNDPSPQ